ncbi:MAG: glycosyltransferase family 39 protein [Planctomycetes bacterium]|nr:glycosyltransferase family 39 protein [Planctomycetota bacterium]
MRDGDDVEVAEVSRRTWLRWTAALLACHIGIGVWLAVVTPWTTDEPTYATAGRLLRAGLVWDTGVARLHGPLPFYANQLAARLGVPDQPLVDYRVAGRLGMLVFPLLGALVTWWTARRWFGRRTSLWALGLYVTCPVLMAHGSLMGTDTSLLPFQGLALLACWQWLTRPGIAALLALGGAIGAALATKYLGLFLVPICGIAVVIGIARGVRPRLLWSRSSDGLAARVADAVAAAVLVGGVAWVTLWACYAFRPPGYDAAAIEPMSRFFASVHRLPGAATWLRVLPEPWVRGVDYMKHFSEQGGSAFLCGRVGPGFAGYYVVALLTKLPVAFLAVLAAGCVWRRPPWPRHALLLTLLGIAIPLAYLSLVQVLQIGLRHLLQVVPLLVLVASRPLADWSSSAGRLGRLRIGVAACALVVAGLAAFHVRAAPRYIGSFNALVAEPWRWFSDSNLDWTSVTYGADPDEQALRARHPAAERVFPQSGPRLGEVVAYAPDLSAVLAPDGRVAHWLWPLTPTDVQGAWLAYRVDDAALQRAVDNATDADRPRRQLDRATALATSGRCDLALRVLDGAGADPRALHVRAYCAAVAGGRTASAEAAALRNALGRFDLVAADPTAPPPLRAIASLQLQRWGDTRSILQELARDRPLATEESMLLAIACRTLQDHTAGIRALEAIELPDGDPMRPRVADLLDELRQLRAESEIIRRRIGG